MNSNDSKKNKHQKLFSINKEDQRNIYARLNIISYLVGQINKDCFDYIRAVVLPKLSIPQDWAILHDPEWRQITVIAPEDQESHKAATMIEKRETGRLRYSAGKEETKPDGNANIPPGVEKEKQGEAPSNQS